MPLSPIASRRRPLRILVICKRRYTGRDLLDDRYGRLFHIPACLSDMGHEVRGIALDVRASRFRVADQVPEDPIWECLKLNPLSPRSGPRHMLHVTQTIRNFRPDVVWSSSDAWHAIVAWRSCVNTNTPFVIDLYDNYESFGLTRIPGMIAGLRASCRNANGLSVVSRSLENFVNKNYQLEAIPVAVVGNAVDPGLFFLQDKVESRKALGLPAEAPLIGTAGALSSSRDIATLFHAAHIIRQKIPNLRVVVAGPRDRQTEKLLSNRDFDLGVISTTLVPKVFNALDAGVICNKDSAFGRYCYPQKYQEMVACGLPVVAADVGEMSLILADRPDMLYLPGSPESLAAGLEKALARPQFAPVEPVTWRQRARQLLLLFDKALSS